MGLVFGGLVACQSTTAPRTTEPVPIAATQGRAGCPAQTATRLTQLDRDIAALEKQQARGYRTKGGVIRVANPIRLCSSPIPFVSACLPQPKITSTLPSYQEYKADRARLAALKDERDRMKKAYPACR